MWKRCKCGSQSRVAVGMGEGRGESRWTNEFIRLSVGKGHRPTPLSSGHIRSHRTCFGYPDQPPSAVAPVLPSPSALPSYAMHTASEARPEVGARLGACIHALMRPCGSSLRCSCLLFVYGIGDARPWGRPFVLASYEHLVGRRANMRATQQVVPQLTIGGAACTA